MRTYSEFLPWQGDLWAQLGRQTQPAHAYLFVGQRGIGKRLLAERLAALWLCHRPQGHQPCGQCKSCCLLRAETHPDYWLLEPESDKAIRVDHIRPLVDFVGHTAHMGRGKVVLIDPAEAMNVAAANALLKTLEEPTASSRLVLISHQPSKLLPTIRSRCISVRCPKPNAASAEAWLALQQPDLSARDRALLLRLSDGAPLTAQWLHQQQALLGRAQVMKDLNALHQNRQWFGPMLDTWQALPVLMILDWFYDWLTQLVRYQFTHDPHDLVDPELLGVLQGISQSATPRQVLAVHDWLLQQRQQVEANVSLNRGLLLEALLIRWLNLAPQN